MRFTHRGLFKSSHVMKKYELRKILANLGLSSTDMNNFFDTKKCTFSLPHHRIIKNCLICQKYNVQIDSLEKFHYCLKLLDYTLEHRINVLKDIGVPVINVSLLNNMIYHFRTKVSTFKNKVNIPAEQNIALNIFREVPRNISTLELNDRLTVQQYYYKCLLYCKNRIFNLPNLDDKILLHSYLKIKSIRMIAETLKVLRLDLHYDEKMIIKNPSVLIASADNIRLLLNGFTNVLGMPVATFLRKYPHILLQNANNVKRLLILLKQYEIPNEHVYNYMNIFLINNETFQERIEIIKRHPDLNMWYKHPRMLQIIYQIKKTKYRMAYVDIMDSSKWAHPQILLASKTVVEKSVQTGIVSSKHNLKHILIKELGIDKSDLLIRHQHWKMASFVDIVQMLKYLKNHFTINEICPNIHIVLYKQFRVEEILADLKHQYSQSTEYSFTNSQYLALCLYMLEKDNHFTGDGVWRNDQNTKQQFLKKQNTVKKSSSNRNFVENINDNFGTRDDVDRNDINDKNVMLSRIT